MKENNKIWSQQDNTYWLRSLGISHKLLPNAVYTLELDPLGNPFLKEVQKEFSFDYKIYGLETHLVDRVKKTFSSVEGNLGILLNGQRGTGKTVTAKLMCNALKMPVIVMDRFIEDGHRFLNSIPQDIIIFIDEYEKIFEENFQLLSIMDGAMNSEHKRVFILTTNELYVNDNLIQRPGRIRYLKTFKDLSREAITEIVNDCLTNTKYRDDVLKFVSTLEMITVDVVKTICQEVNLHNQPPEKFAEFFNVKKVSGKFDVYLVDDRGARTTTLPFVANAKVSPNQDFEEDDHIYINNDYIGRIIDVLDENIIKVRISCEEEGLNRTQKKFLGIQQEEEEAIHSSNEMEIVAKPSRRKRQSKKVEEEGRIPEAEFNVEISTSEAYNRMYRYVL